MDNIKDENLKRLGKYIAVWATEGKDVWISIFERSTDGEYSLCTFVGTPDKLIKKYDTN